MMMKLTDTQQIDTCVVFQGKLFSYTAYVMLHRRAHVQRFHLLSKQWSCEW